MTDATPTASRVIDGVDLSGRVAVVTGASGGMGLVIARSFAAAGATVVLANRNAETSKTVIKEIATEIPGAIVESGSLDLTSLASVRAFADGLLAKYARVDILVNNAGVMATPFERTVDGFELQLGTNHLGHFVLTNRLLPALLQAPGARVVNVSSAAHFMSGIIWDDVNYDHRPYDAWEAYGQSKTANILFGIELQRRFGDRGVLAFSVHPGVVDTGLFRYLSAEERVGLEQRAAGRGIATRTAQEGAATAVFASISPTLVDQGGSYLEDCHVGQAAPHARGAEEAARLWEISEKLVGESFPGVTDLAADVRATLARFLPARDHRERVTTLGAGGVDVDVDVARGYLANTVADGWAVPAWPRRLGGRDASSDDVAVIAQIHREFAVPDLYPVSVGIKMVGPTLLEHGAEEQQARWLPPIAGGEHIWCQLFSEPDAGSDLANVATTARRCGDHWVLNGQKVWTSRAAYADWGICLARTDPERPKHAGLTMFAIPMSAPGVDVRPLVQMNGDDHFSEVFLTDVAVPDGDRIGAVDGGWNVAVSLLAHERAGADRSAPRPASSSLPTWLADLAEAGALDAPVVRDRAMALFCLEEAIRLTQARTVANRRSGRTGPEGSSLKLTSARLFKERLYLSAVAAGAHAMLMDWDGAIEMLTAPSMSIRGGTDEIQRNIIGERVLGLPAELRVDRDLAWAASRHGKGGTCRATTK